MIHTHTHTRTPTLYLNEGNFMRQELGRRVTQEGVQPHHPHHLISIILERQHEECPISILVNCPPVHGPQVDLVVVTDLVDIDCFARPPYLVAVRGGVVRNKTVILVL